MSYLISKILSITLRVVLIMIIISGLFACSSNQPNSGATAYNGRVYKVNKGDTLYSIALRYGLYYKDLAAFNDIDPPYAIYAGQVLRVDLKQARTLVTSSPSSSRSVITDRSKKATKNGSVPSSSASFLSTPKWQWPAQGKIIAHFQGETGSNKGIDLGGKLGEPVLAPVETEPEVLVQLFRKEDQFFLEQEQQHTHDDVSDQ